MSNNVNLNRAIAARNDEYYTPMKTVQQVFEVYLKTYDFTNKIIYCPCDSTESNFVKYLIAHKSDLNYKELIYTWDDYNGHGPLFNKADIIITNPPFSKLIREFLPLLNYYQKEFFIFGCFGAIEGYYHCLPNVNFYYTTNSFETKYITDKNKEKIVSTIYITNLNLDKNFSKKKFVPTATELSNLYALKGNIRTYDRMTDIPCKEFLPDPKEIFLVPCSVLLQHNRYLFNILSSYRYKEYSDGKRRFPKILVQYK